MLAELTARLFGVLLLPALVLACLAAGLGWEATAAVWLGWLVLALLADAVLPPVTSVAPADRVGAGLEAVLLCLPVLAHAGVLAWALWRASDAPDAWQALVLAIPLGISGGTVGISAAHELLHRRHPAARALAQACMALVGYPHFPVVHLQVHHPLVGTRFDPGTSQRNEPLAAFLPRALALAWTGAWRAESRRMSRLGLPAWHWRSRMVRALTLQALVVAGVWLLFGPWGLLLFAAQGIVAVFMMLVIDYTQHYGVQRREVAPNRLERFGPAHAWSAPQASNRSTFNLGLHADHHLVPARRYAELDNADGSLQAPFGYPGLFLLALVPPLWFRVMNPRLARGGTR